MSAFYFSGRSSNGHWLAETLAKAAETGRSIRFQTGEDAAGPWLKVKVGEGMWSPPYRSEPDPYGVVL